MNFTILPGNMPTKIKQNIAKSIILPAIIKLQMHYTLRATCARYSESRDCSSCYTPPIYSSVDSVNTAKVTVCY
jgi:hypothetical protein